MTRALEIAALALVAIAAATQHPLTGWNAGAHYALVQSLADGTPRIDHHLNQSGDIAYVDGHYYAAKSPGLAVLSLPVYAAFDATGSVTPTSATTLGPPGARGIQEHALWQVNLVVIACFFCLLVLVRTAVGWIIPGAGLAVALMLGLGTMLLPLATVYFSHVPSATLGFAAFALVLRTRSRPAGLTIALAGLLAGLAVFMEVTLAVVAACLGVYAVVMGPRLQRAVLYGAGFVVGILPLAAYNWWAFGSPFENGYSHAVKELGHSGHAVIGANAAGFFGVTHPSLGALRQILVSERGFFAITPITVIALAGLVPLARRGYRPEAVLIGGTTLAMFVFNASYYLPMGGAAPGPRFLTPLLPLLALPLAAALRAWPAITIAGAIVSAFWMIVATVGEPILDPALAPSAWVAHVVHGTDLAQSVFGVGRTAELVFAVPVVFALFVGLLLPTLLEVPGRATATDEPT